MTTQTKVNKQLVSVSDDANVDGFVNILGRLTGLNFDVFLASGTTLQGQVLSVHLHKGEHVLTLAEHDEFGVPRANRLLAVEDITGVEYL